MTKPIGDYEIMEAMRLYGGSFASALAMAAYHADADNLATIKAAFPDLWEEYRELALARQNAPGVKP
jgi:hypothetical protein